jgi:hypothetical protein
MARRKMERVIEMTTEPIVGKRYLVPCVFNQGEWWPVYGPPHEDAEIIKFPDTHFHYDWRFMPDEEMIGYNGDRSHSRVLSKGTLNFRVYEKVRVCKRKMLEFPVLTTSRAGPEYGLKEIPFARALELAFAGENVIETSSGCRLCPHRKFRLNGLPTRDDGSVVCPGHGLCWGSDGKMVKRTTDIPKT